MQRYALTIFSSFLSAVLAVFLYRYFAGPEQVIVGEAASARYTYEPSAPLNGVQEITQSTPFTSARPTSFINAAAIVTPAVVNIQTIQGGGSFPFLRNGGVRASSGSGVIISTDGYIVTNHHVVEEADQIQVTLSDKRELPAELIGADPSTDLALIKIKSGELPFLQFGDSDSLRIGEWVMAVGNPFNLESTVTAGIVSAKGRSIDILEGQDRIESFIQTDAAVNPGNSGGALVNTHGDLIGINTAIITRSGRYEGYSFAVPSNLARKVIQDLKDYGMVQRGLMGVFIEEVDNERARELRLESVEGVYITRITPGGGADEAGLRKGDVIISVNGARTPTLPKLQEQVGRLRPGNTITIEFFRKGRIEQTTVTLKNRDNTTTMVHARHRIFLEKVGFELRDLTDTEIRKFGQDGVKVRSIFKGSLIDQTNMDPDFIITRINQEAVYGLDQLVDLMQRAKGPIVLEGFYEHLDDSYFYTFSLEELE